MVKSQSSTLIRCPVPDVYGFVVTDFVRNYPRWSPEVQKLTPLSNGPLAVGWTARQVRIDQGRRSEADFRVIALEPQRRVCFKGIKDPFEINYFFEPQQDQTRLTFSFELARLNFAMRPFEKLIRVAVKDGTERVVRDLRALVERELGQTRTD
ncbi:polyketide cyclase/dehydrase/lipid transport protein [Halomonas ventosae]|uniref:Polyketide cyclase/dehydrase/lipid transport protein n=1 Tax=Halomonas ventosae TaxID=229007 RepID=A0A4R6ZTK9_9GAMM|nr:SRPBCC family protein [Halomonas ventosae]TDR55985.1 polyketide cyclase/dehydrase/lipid transport protein [Halomonas ventosae]